MFIKSKFIRSPHGFCTRNGGVSILEHTKSLNLAFGRGDEDTIVLKNLSALANEAGFAPESVISLPQIHSDIVYRVGARDAGQGYFLKDNIRSGDGYGLYCEGKRRWYVGGMFQHYKPYQYGRSRYYGRRGWRLYCRGVRHYEGCGWCVFDV
jgi:hypothetical protein